MYRAVTTLYRKREGDTQSQPFSNTEKDSDKNCHFWMGWKRKRADRRVDREKKQRWKKREISTCRIGEASNPGPVHQNKQASQRKLGNFFVKNQRHIDTKSEWCKDKGFRIHNIKGDGNCLFTCLGKDMEMNGAQ
eukprot:15863325-Heterocapsa_arctica.AAC.2